MTFDDDALNRLVPASLWKPDWADALAVIGVVLTALIALGAENARWFFEF